MGKGSAAGGRVLKTHLIWGDGGGREAHHTLKAETLTCAHTHTHKHTRTHTHKRTHTQWHAYTHTLIDSLALSLSEREREREREREAAIIGIYEKS